MDKPLTHKSIIKIQEILKQPKTTQCEDCGMMCTNRIVEHKKRITPETHWMTKCTECNLCKNPYTGKFEMNIAEVNKAWRQYLKSMQF